MTRVQKLKPGVKKIWLQIAAGLTWSAVGVMLILFAIRWIGLVTFLYKILIIAVGALLAVIIHRFGFSKLARVNIQRINNYLNERVCLFAFQKWSSYPLVVFMIGLGIYLRKYSPIPKPYLAVLYMGIGGGLFLSSLLYHGFSFRWIFLTLTTSSGVEIRVD